MIQCNGANVLIEMAGVYPASVRANSVSRVAWR